MIIVGDVHGCLKTLQALLGQVPKGRDIAFVGDLVDRGPDSPGVLNFVKDNGWAVVRGNHEDMMLHHFDKTKKCSDYFSKSLWLYNGGDPMLYDDAQLDWVASWPLYLDLAEVKNQDGRSLFLSHAAPYSHDEEQWVNLGYRNFELSVLWNRDLPQDDGKRFFVFGHTPNAEPLITTYYAMIDTGCVYKKRSKSLGVLTAYDFVTGETYQQPCID